jgi:hypothetical protein
MIKKILAWITGKSDTKVAEAAPYKVETPAVTVTTEQRYVGENEQGAVYETVVVDQLQKAHDAVVASGQPDDSKGLDEAIAAQAAKPAVEVAPVTVKAKYKRADLNKMTKAQLMELITKHGVEVKARSTKEELVKVLVKV